MLKSVPQEGIQEGLDAIGELVNTKYDTAAYKDMTLKELVAKESDNIMASILTGAAGGAHMGGPKIVYDTGRSLLNNKVASKVSANTAKLADDMLTSKLTKTNNEIAAVKADSALDATTKAAKIKELKDSVGVANTLGHYVKGTTFSNADFAVRANDHITKFKEANGGEGPELDKLTSILLIDRLPLLLCRLSTLHYYLIY